MQEYLIIFILLILVIAIAVFFVQSRQKSPEWKEKVMSKLNQLVKRINMAEEHVLITSAVVDADKLMDYCFQKRGLKGKTAGDRLKNAKNMFEYEMYDSIWKAHKVRNKIVHEVDYKISDDEAKKHFSTLQKAILKMSD